MLVESLGQRLAEKSILVTLLALQPYMSNHVVMFRFRLSDRQTIGPAALRELWSAACCSNDVKVSRVASGASYGDRGYAYSLWAAPNTPDLRIVETRLQRLLVETMPTATIKLTNLR
jgi:hypothetical protein